MAKALPTLIRMSKFEVDERQRALADLLRARDEIVRQQNELEAQKNREEQSVREHPELSSYYAGYINVYLERKEKLAKSLEDLDIIIDQARRMLEEAYQQLKTYEITKDNIDKIELAELELKDQKNADEMALNTHRRKSKK